GVSGDTSSAGMARLEWVLSSYDDLDLVIVLFGGNDALRGLHPDMTRRNMDKMIGILKEKNIPTLIAGMVAPPNMGQVYGNNFNSIYSEVAKKYETALYPFYLDGVAGILELNQNDRIHPNEDGVKHIVERLTPIVYEIVSDE
ncbi:MAG: arylesterase, partial [Emcibacteraceae bacterium]|nr:arylesterase [Emcibacteraceae bacterium]